MDNTFFESEDQLKQLLTTIDTVFDTNAILVEPISKNKIQKYYRQSNFGYNLVHSKEGSVHMAINYDGVFDQDGYYQQVKEISEHLVNEKIHVLELGCGKGFNSTYLAKAFPATQFSGIDITEQHLIYAKKRAKSKENLHFTYGDFHQLVQSDSSMDLVFELEAVCHTDKPEVVLREVHRVLKSGGKFILYEGFRSTDFKNRTKVQKEAAVLIEKTMAVNNGHNISEWLSLAEKTGFTVYQNDDISHAIMPNLKRFHRLAMKFFGSKILKKALPAFLSKNLIKNTIAGSLMPFSIMQKTQTYNRIILVKQ